MRVALDVMGGDYSPGELIEGALLALQEIPNIEKIFLVGDETLINNYKNLSEFEKLEILHTPEFISMDEHPAEAYRKKRNASITLATRLVKDGKADVVLSAGNTGAQLAAGLFELKRIPGIKRPAIAVFLPTQKGPKLLIDTGANTNVNEEILHQFAIMGSLYYAQAYGVEKPRVGLINNGSEPTKGSELTQKAWQVMNNSDKINFVGNVEGRDISSGVVDVYVCDGFTGNIILKTMEGLGKTIFQMLKEEINTSLKYKIGGLCLKDGFKEIYKKLDPNRVGGAPLLGLQGVSIVCHGSSKREAILFAFKNAKEYYDNQVIQKIEDAVTAERGE